MATPRVMEPTLLTEIQCTADALGAISTVTLNSENLTLKF